MKKIILGSASIIRKTLLSNAGIDFVVDPATIDENSIKESLELERTSHEDIVQTLSDFKALNRASIWPNDIIISCDQILSHKGKIFSKPENIISAKKQISILNGSKHHLITAATIIENKEIVWRNISKSEMLMRNLNDNEITNYVEKIGEDITKSVGGYMIEREGIKLFEKIKGDYFSILGIPLLEIINFLNNKKLLV
tara:strand:- start:6 stop:599 length:594 start_codon:yes stop_codon:yes gene_type:complete